MKVALVTGHCVPGECGVGDYSRRLAQALKSLGIQVEIVSEGGWRLRDAASAYERINIMRADIIHLQYPAAGFGHLLGPQLLAMRKSCVITIHEASQTHILRKLSLYPFTVRSRHLIFTNIYEKQFLVRRAPWISRISSVIPLGTNIDPWPNPIKRTAHEVAYFGLIMPKKGLEEVLHLANLFKSAHSQISLRIVGKTHPKHKAYSVQLRQRSKELPVIWDSDLSDEEVRARLASCSVAYLPFPDGASERRSSLRAVLASGIAVVTTRGGHTPIDLEGIVKFATDVNDAYEIIRGLVNDRSELDRLRQKGIGYMRHFSWDYIGLLHRQLYENLVRLRPSGQEAACHEGKELLW